MSSELRELWINAGGRVPQDWNIVSLETLFQDAKGIAVGVMYPGTHAVGGIPLIKVGDIKGGCIPVQPDFCISVETNHEYRRSQLVGNELLITLVGNPGECVVVTPQMAGWNPARAIAVIKLKDTGLRTYVKTVLESAAGKHLIDSVLNTTVQKTLNLKDIRRLPIPMPAGSTINNISTLSEAFSDRIALLRETNQTLEAVAQALFKSWFVDFDPVRAKAEGRLPEGIDEATAALFPDSFDVSALGMIPKGWRVSPIYDIAAVTYGAPFASKLFKANPPGRPLVRIRDLKDERPGVYTEEVHPKGYLIQPGDIVVGMDGEFRSYVWGGEEAWLNQRVCIFTPINDACAAFVRLSITPLLAAVEASETATTVIHLGKNDIDRFKIICPSPNILKIFGEIVNPIYNRFVKNKQQMQTLSNLRDTLLPRLISGQLRLAEAEVELEKALA